jgi:acetylornithine deacetylase
VHGRGACDAKGAIAAMLAAADRLRERGCQQFGLLFVVGEETNSDGAKVAARKHLDSEYVIIGEPTENRLAAGQKGAIVFKVKSTGLIGHSAYPEKGDSALHRLVKCLDIWLQTDWGRDDLLGASTLNIGRISGGSGANVIAGESHAEGIFRVSTSVDAIKKQFYAQLDDHIEVEIMSESEPQKLMTLDSFETTTVSFGSDAAYLRPLGEILLIGPGSAEHAHSDHEQVTVAELTSAVDHYVTLVEKLLTMRKEN